MGLLVLEVQHHDHYNADADDGLCDPAVLFEYDGDRHWTCKKAVQHERHGANPTQVGSIQRDTDRTTTGGAPRKTNRLVGPDTLPRPSG